MMEWVDNSPDAGWFLIGALVFAYLVTLYIGRRFRATADVQRPDAIDGNPTETEGGFCNVREHEGQRRDWEGL